MEEKDGWFTFNALLRKIELAVLLKLLSQVCVSSSQGLGRSVVCDCGISWSYLLGFLLEILDKIKEEGKD